MAPNQVNTTVVEQYGSNFWRNGHEESMQCEKVQKARVVLLQFRAPSANSFTQTTHNAKIIFFVEGLTKRKETQNVQ